MTTTTTEVKSKKASRKFRQALLDELLTEMQEPKKDLFGTDGMFQNLKAALMERMLEGELTHHLGYGRHEPAPETITDRRNGSYAKTVHTSEDTVTVQIPRDRDGDFKPQLLKKGQRRLEGFDDKVISLYARGMSMREIQEHLYEIYGTDVSHDLISDITDSVLEEVKAWQNRSLESVYPFLYLDAIIVKVRESNQIVNKAVHLAIGVTVEGKKELLGMWMAKTEGAKFWLSVLTELKNRGVKDIFIACVDGLTGFPEAINAVFPGTTVQLCVVHMVRNSLRFVPFKDQRAVASDLRAIYTAPSRDAAEDSLLAFREKWDTKYPTIGKSWTDRWTEISPCFSYPADIRRVVYTTNTIESINRQIRKIIKTKGAFPTDDAALKLMFLALKNAQKKWTMPLREWKQALNQLAILFPERLP